MSLNEIASVSGKPGLYKVVKPTRTGIILETIDHAKKKLIANANSRVSLLKEISIYTTTGSEPLEKVLSTIKSKNQGDVEVPSTDGDLYTFLGTIVKDYDKERVYPSDIKKLILWFNILNEFFPELISEDKKEADKKKPTKKES